MKLLFNFLALLGVFATVADASAELKPVPNSWVTNEKLAVPELNFSINHPSLGLHWSYISTSIEGARATEFKTKTETAAYVLGVWERSTPAIWPETEKKAFSDSLYSDLPYRGWQVMAVDFESVNLPLYGATKIKIKLSATTDVPAGFSNILYQYMYYVSGEPTYFFRMDTVEDKEPDAFAEWISSFSLINPRANALAHQSTNHKADSNPKTDSNPMGIGLLFLVLAIIGAAIDREYKRRGGMRPTRAHKVCFLVSFLMCLALIVLAYPDGRLEAHLTVLFGPLLFFLWELGRWRMRRQHPLADPARGSDDQHKQVGQGVIDRRAAKEPGRVETGLRRLSLALAVLAAGFGGFGTYGTQNNGVNSQAFVAGAVIGGAVIGFVAVWAAMAVVRWIIAGFMKP